LEPGSSINSRASTQVKRGPILQEHLPSNLGFGQCAWGFPRLRGIDQRDAVFPDRIGVTLELRADVSIHPAFIRGNKSTGSVVAVFFVR
jgi:hypothetical protein